MVKDPLLQTFSDQRTLRDVSLNLYGCAVVGYTIWDKMRLKVRVMTGL